MARVARYLLPFEMGALDIGAAERLALFGPKGDVELGPLPMARVLCEQSFYPDHKALAMRGLEVSHELDQPIDAAVVFLGRSRALAQATVARALHYLPPGGPLIVDGAKTDGIGSLLSAIAAHVPMTDSQARDHGKVAWFAKPTLLPPELLAWAKALEPGKTAEGYWTAAGLFSADGLDPGSALLAEQFGPALTGRAADFGGGWGALTALLAARAPELSRIDLYEADWRALSLAKRNIADTRAAFHWADVNALSPADVTADLIVANPPFHMGRKPDPALGERFIRAAARCLAPRGRFLMVANRQLPYERVLASAFADWSIVEERGGYKIVEARRPL